MEKVAGAGASVVNQEKPSGERDGSLTPTVLGAGNTE